MVQPACGRKKAAAPRDTFPDGTPISAWFRDTSSVNIASFGRQYRITDYGVLMDNYVHTKELQGLIDKVAADGGGVIVVPPGVFMTGALFFKQGTHLHLERGAVLRGSTDISDFPVMTTRIEGQTCKYYPALLNADSIQGFTITGEGVVDGNGLPYWRAFWQRWQWNPVGTNKDEQRPRVLYISNCRDVQIEGVCFQNSPFWTTHYYRSENVKLLNLNFFSPTKPVRAPSTDAIDIDACRNVLIKGCNMSVDDDAIALKGGKGPWADDPEKSPGNGGNENIIIEDCRFGFCHSCLTCGSESIYNHNILLRRGVVEGAGILLHLKMRTDTPQRYEFIIVEDMHGRVGNFLHVHSWSQFANMEGRTTPPMSYGSDVTMRRITMECGQFFNVAHEEDKFRLSRFLFEDLDIKAQNSEVHPEYIDSLTISNVKINDKEFFLPIKQ
jgi:polygalacturonase